MSPGLLSSLKRVTGLALVLGGLLVGFLFANKSGNNPNVYSNDFSVYYHAAREMIDGRDPYAHSLGDWTPYIYPPLLAELLVPLALLPLPVAAYIWFLINAASIVFAAFLSVTLLRMDTKAVGQESHAKVAGIWKEALAAGAVLLVFRFVLDTFTLGQVNALIAGLAVAHIYLYNRGRRVLSAIVLAFAISIKLTPALLLVYHLAKMRLKFSIACAGLVVAVTIASLLPFGSSGTDVFQVFLRRTVKNEQGYDFSYSGNQSLRGAIARLRISNTEAENSADARNAIDWSTIVGSILLLSLGVFAARRVTNELAAVAPFFCGFVLVSSLSWKAHYVVLIPAAALLLYEAVGSKKRAVAIAAYLAPFVLFNFTSQKIIGVAAAEWADEHSLVLVGALIVFIVCVFLNLLVNKSKAEDVVT
ncbi:MAG TPA: glycosyltransferase family 87 protein [Blastocatellia bacterium]|nr:glycosyltransferase family 87 protein [Blastocatellia bacterium]